MHRTDATSPPTPIRMEGDPQLTSAGSAPAATRSTAARCPASIRPVPPLLGCDACGAPINTSPDPVGSVEGALPFLDPQFYADLLEYFSSSGRRRRGDTGRRRHGDGRGGRGRRAARHSVPRVPRRLGAAGDGDPIIASAIIGFPVSVLPLPAARGGQCRPRWRSSSSIVELRARRSPSRRRRPSCASASSCNSRPPSRVSRAPDVVWSVQEPAAGRSTRTASTRRRASCRPEPHRPRRGDECDRSAASGASRR